MPHLHDVFHRLADLARDRWQDDRATPAFGDKGSGAFDPVTALDHDIETLLRGALIDAFPDDGVWGEEQGWSNFGAPRHWSLDPVDGTRALICGLPSWSVLVGLIENGLHRAGMIYLPVVEERLIAVDGRTTLNGAPVSASRCTRLADARLATTDPYLFEGDEAERFQKVRAAARLSRYGLDALAYARVATGDIDLVVENRLQRHDLDALVAVVRGAGGVVGDWTGGEDWDSGRIIAAATRDLYDEAVSLLAS